LKEKQTSIDAAFRKLEGDVERRKKEVQEKSRETGLQEETLKKKQQTLRMFIFSEFFPFPFFFALPPSFLLHPPSSSFLPFILHPPSSSLLLPPPSSSFQLLSLLPSLPSLSQLPKKRRSRPSNKKTKRSAKKISKRPPNWTRRASGWQGRGRP
jgi:hypothetical protein